jgi:hypothetical protein
MMGVSVLKITGVFTGTVEVARKGVAVLAPTTEGVAVTMEGVRVGGKNGVGGLYPEGWKNQPLQEVSDTVRHTIKNVFISSPPVIVSRPG